MAFNLGDIISRTNLDGAPINTAHFSVDMPYPGKEAERGRMLSFYISSTSLPGLGFEVAGIKRHGYGLVENRPVAVNFNTINLRILVDGNAEVVKIFQSWFESISGFRSDSAEADYSLFKYPSEYEVDMSIHLYDQAAQKTLTYKLVQAWPSMIGDVQMDWSSTNQLMYLPITFMYKKYSIVETNQLYYY